MYLYVNLRCLALITALTLELRVVTGNSTPPGSMLPTFNMLSQTLPPATTNPATHATASRFITVTTPTISPLSSVPPGGLTSSPSGLTPTPIATMSLPSSLNQNQSRPFGWVEDNGHEWGNVVIHNHCAETLYLKSEGVHPLGGFRDDSTGFGSEKDQIPHTILPGKNYSEPYRITCPIPLNMTRGYCWSQDKLYGQGVSMKISRTLNSSDDISQMEWALVHNPFTKDNFQRLNYDFSLLDCADPYKNQAAYKVKSPPPPSSSGAPAPTAVVAYHSDWREISSLTDVTANAKDHEIKVQKCPGYVDGIKVSFPNNTAGGKCEPIDCDGTKMCAGIYTFDKTRKDEPSKACHEEYRGDMVVDLCAGRINQTGSAR